MKKDIHPAYGDATITCACGNVIKTRSTKKEMTVNTCSACHPYFTGAKTLVDTEGRVDSFNVHKVSIISLRLVSVMSYFGIDAHDST